MVLVVALLLGAVFMIGAVALRIPDLFHNLCHGAHLREHVTKAWALFNGVNIVQGRGHFTKVC